MCIIELRTGLVTMSRVTRIRNCPIFKEQHHLQLNSKSLLYVNTCFPLRRGSNTVYLPTLLLQMQGLQMSVCCPIKVLQLLATRNFMQIMIRDEFFYLGKKWDEDRASRSS